MLSPVYTANTKPTLQWNGLPEKYKFDPFVDSEHTDDYHTKDNKDAWGPKVSFHATTSRHKCLIAARRMSVIWCLAAALICGFHVVCQQT